ncbi:MAG: transposase [Synergistaceae bacterium]
MILTYRIKHDRDFSSELSKALKIAKFAIRTKSRSSKDVSFFGLKSIISNQILKKYAGQKNCKLIHSVKLTIPNQGINVDQEERIVNIPCIKLKLQYHFPNNFNKVNQIEIDNKYCYISCQFPDKPEIEIENYIGLDRNTTGHIAVGAIVSTGKVYKLGKKAYHTHRKYKKIRAHLQEKGAKKKLKRIRKREKNIIKDINHKTSRKIVEIAKDNKCGIALEDLKGIRKGKRSNKINKTGESFKSSINSWEFYQLQTMIEYKAKICGIPLVYVDPKYTSQKCSKCGLIAKNNRKQKKYTCTECGHVDHADANAAFNISALAFQRKSMSNDQSIADRDVMEGSTDTPQLETQHELIASVA